MSADDAAIRVLVADDDPAVTDAYRSILETPEPTDMQISDLRARLFGAQGSAATRPRFVASYVRSAEEAVAAVRESLERGERFALAFLDMRMPPGQDGAWAAAEIRKLDERIDIVIATAYSDTDPAELSARIVPASKMFYLQKPFHPHEIRQLALAVGERRKAEETVYRLAYYDDLTGLPNRARFLDGLDRAIGEAAARGTGLAVLFLDLDRFKRINDTLGHAAGDRVLRETARRITGVLRADDLVLSGGVLDIVADDGVARLGGDEFTVLLSGLDGAESALSVARRVHAVLAAPIVLEEQEIVAAPSIGIALYPEDGTDSGTLIRSADMAMYEAKHSTAPRIHLFTASLKDKANRRMTLERELRRAIEREELSLHFQPQLDLRDGEIAGMEALLRWRNPTLGDVPPLQFIPIAEESGLIVPIGEWVLRVACTRTKAWQEAGLNFGRVAVNVSAVQFSQQSFPETVRAALDGSGLDAASLELEITESVLMGEAERAVGQLERLKAIGVRLAIDDFGTGYSSLSYLKRFPIDRLKIDRSFVTTILSDANDQAIASAVIAMAERMSLCVTAEGVENVEQLRFLQRGNCDEAQGFGIGRPMPAEQAEAFLRARPRGRTRAA